VRIDIRSFDIPAII